MAEGFVNRQIYPDSTGNGGYFFDFISVASGPLVQCSIKQVSFLSATVITQGPLFTVGHDPVSHFNLSAAYPPICGYNSGSLWVPGKNTGDTNTAVMREFDRTTFALLNEFTTITGGATSALGAAISGDGRLYAVLTDTGVFVFDTLTHGSSLYDYSTVIPSGGNFVALVIDAANRLWTIDDAGLFWYSQLTSGSPPTMVAFSSVDSSQTSFAGALSMSYNPASDVVTGYVQVGGMSGAETNILLVTINASTRVVGAVGTINLNWELDFADFGSANARGWITSDYIGIINDTGTPPNPSDPKPGLVGVYQRSTDITTFYPWSYWGASEPSGFFISQAAIGQTFAGITAIVGDLGAPSGNPHQQFFFSQGSDKEFTLADICADVSDRVGLDSSQYDYSALAVIVPQGVALLNRQTARSFIEAMGPAYFFDLVDIGALVTGILRSAQSLLVTIPEADLAAAEDVTTIKDKISSQRGDDLEIPQDLEITYYDIQHDYQQGGQPSRRSRITQYSSGRNTITVPVVMSPGEASNSAERGLYMLWVERTPRKFSLPLDYVYLTPGDVVGVTRGGEVFTVRISRTTLNPSQVIDCESVSEDLGVYSITAPPALSSVVSGSFAPGTINPVVGPVLALLDTATLRVQDSNPGLYVAGCASEYGAGWDGEVVQDSPDNSNWTSETTLLFESTMGATTNVLADCPRWTVWDYVSTVRVTLLSGVLASASMDDLVVNLANMCWFANGECAQFLTATLVTGNTYDLTGWLRGRLGTESFTGTHASGEQFVVLDASTLGDVDFNASEIGATRYWRGSNDAATGSPTAVQTIPMTCRRLKCFAPWYIRGARDIPGNLTITGLRRMRWRGKPLWTPSETDPPVTMEIDIINGTTVVRTLKATLSAGGSGITDPSAFAAYYSIADQTADFVVAPASLTIIAYEINSVVGRGYGKVATI